MNKWYLVWGWVIAEPDIPVDAEVDVLEGELRDGWVELNDFLGHAGDVRLPVLEGASVLAVVGYK